MQKKAEEYANSLMRTNKAFRTAPDNIKSLLKMSLMLGYVKGFLDGKDSKQ